MTEQDKNNTPKEGNELTNQSNFPKLESEGDIFMADGPTTSGPEGEPVDKGPESTPPRKESPISGEGDGGGFSGSGSKGPELFSDEYLARMDIVAMAAMAELKRSGIDLDAGYDFVSEEDGLRHVFHSVSEMMAAGRKQVRQQAAIAGENLKKSVDAIDTHTIAIADSSTEPTVRTHVDAFVAEIEKIEHLFSDSETDEEMRLGEYKNYDELKKALKSGDTKIEDLKEIVKFLTPKVKAHYSPKETDRPPDMPLSLEDLVALVIQRAEDEYKRGGEFALLEEVKVGDETVERVNLAHFYEWVRHQIWRVHENNPTSEANFFTDEGMGVKTSFRTINFYEIVFTPSFFHEKKTLMVDSGKRDKDGKIIPELIEQNVENEEYEALRQQIYKETFLFMLMRNGDWGYRDNMAGEKGMMQALEAVYKNNPLTRGNFLETILSMSSMSRASLGEEGGGRKLKEKAEVNFIMGDAIRRAWGAYMHVWDYDMVSQYLGGDSAFFKQEFEEHDEKGKVKPTKKPSMANKDWFDPKTGILKPEHTKEYMEFMNLFLGPTANQNQLAEVREKMVLSLMEKEGISYSEAKLAEAWAFSLSNFTGLSARNDTHSVGFQQWTKEQNLEDYRDRQMAEQRRAKYGSKYTIRGLKRIALSFMEAALTTDKRALYEVVQGGQGGVVDLENNPIKSYVDFERDYERDGSGFIVFKKHSGKVDKGLVGKVRDYRLADPDAKGVRKVIFIDSKGEAVDVGKSHAVKTEIVLKDADGTRKEDLHATTYEVDRNGNIVFKDATGNILDVEGLDAQKILIEARQKLEFDDQIQRQFIPNHMEMVSNWFRFVIDSEEMDFRGMFEGWNPETGTPIINQKKLKEVKEGIRKNITYALSTWPGTDYTKTIRTWERTEDGLVARDVSILESMFGTEVLDFIAKEAKASRRKSILTEADIDVHNLAESHDKLTDEQKKELKLAIWEGVFTYMVSKEITAHRDWNSNLERYGLEDMTAVYRVLHDGEVLYDDEASWVKADSKTSIRRLFAESFGAAVAEGGAKGGWKILKLLLKDILS